MITGVGLSKLADLAKLQKLSLYMCKNFYRTSIKEFLNFTTLKEVNLGGCYKIALDALKYLRRLSQLEALTLTHCTKLTDISLHFLASHTKLTYLDLSECEFTNQGIDSIKHLGIRYLKFSDSEFVDNITFLNIARGFSNLNNLILEHLPEINDDAFILLVGSLELRKLRLSSIDRITDKGFSCLLCYQKLNELYVEQCPNITPYGWVNLSKSEQLCFLTIHKQKLSGEAFLGLAQLKNITCLKIESAWGFTQEDVNHFAKSKTLQVLSIRQLSVTDALIKSIAKISMLKSVTLTLTSSDQLPLLDQLMQLKPKLKINVEETF